MSGINYDRVALKERARMSLRKANVRPWKATLVFVLVAAVLPGVITGLLPDANREAAQAMFYDLAVNPDYIMGMIQRWGFMETRNYYRDLCAPGLGVAVAAYLVTLLIGFFRMVMNFGYTYYALKLYRREETRIGDVFHGFSLAGQAIGTGIMTGLFTLLWTLPVLALEGCAVVIFVAVLAASALSEGAMLVLTVLFVGALMVALVVYIRIISYRYLLAPYYIFTSDRSIMESIRESKTVMRNNLGRRFVLDLSFLGWELLDVLILLTVFAAGCFVTYAAAIMYVDIVSVFYLDWNMYMIGLTVEIVLSLIAGVAAAMPLELWIVAYEASAQAGFFLAVTGQERKGEATLHNFPPPPPRPAGGSIWDNVPTPPGFTAPPPVPPAPPEPPVEEEAAQEESVVTEDPPPQEEG